MPEGEAALRRAELSSFAMVLSDGGEGILARPRPRAPDTTDFTVSKWQSEKRAPSSRKRFSQLA